jgi:cobalamin biosynthetic protein CobC
MNAPFFAHGGRLVPAAEAFPNAPRPWVDLSTGISPFAYPLPELPADSWARLPDPADLTHLETAAAGCFEVADARGVVAVPGSEIGLRLLSLLRDRSRVAIASPTYASHAGAWAGHDLHRLAWQEIAARLDDFDVVVVVRPNNPDGEVIDADALEGVALRLAERGGWLIVDEAFAETPTPSFTGAIRLRSFGKFFGLAGLRLGFVIGDEPLVGRLRALLGEWPVSGPGKAITTPPNSEHRWQGVARAELAAAGERLDRLLAAHGWKMRGGTLLFRLVDDPRAGALFIHLARAGILTRPFFDQPQWLRFGLPGQDAQWRRLEAAIASFPGEYR